MCNVGGIDRIIHIIAGLFLISLVFIGDQIIGQNVVWGWVGYEHGRIGKITGRNDQAG